MSDTYNEVSPEKELEEFLYRDLTSELWGNVPLGGFFHYTSIAGMRGILQSRPSGPVRWKE